MCRLCARSPQFNVGNKKNLVCAQIVSFMCDHCMTIIPTNSVTFHCNQCHDFDLCQNCFDQKIEKDVDYYYRGEKFTVKHTPEHPMEKVL